LDLRLEKTIWTAHMTIRTSFVDPFVNDSLIDESVDRCGPRVRNHPTDFGPFNSFFTHPLTALTTRDVCSIPRYAAAPLREAVGFAL